LYEEALGLSTYECLFRKAVALTGLKYYEHACELLYQLLEITPNNADILIFRAEIHKHLGNVDFANLDVIKASKINPLHTNLTEIIHWITTICVDYKNKAAKEFLTGHFHEAIWYYDHAIELDPEDWMLILNRGKLYAQLHYHENAIQDFLSVLNNPKRDTQRDKDIELQVASIYHEIGLEFSRFEF
jgi:tetratricopeptide (TPR) repeat protein